jgi:hypothetical protein
MIRNLPAQSVGCTTWLRSLSSDRAGVRIILDAFDARQADNTRRAAAGLPPTRRKRRITLVALSASPP